MTRFAEVAVNSPAAGRRTYSYEIPPDMELGPGHAVLVPFGPRQLQGIVFELTSLPAPEAADRTRPIAQTIGVVPALLPHQLALSRWISDNYLCPLFEAAAMMLPPGFERRWLTYYSCSPTPPFLESLTAIQREVWHLLEQKGRVELAQLRKSLRGREGDAVLAQMVRQGFILRTQELSPVRVRQKTAPYLRLSIAGDEIARVAAQLRERKAFPQAQVLETLARQPGPVSLPEAKKLAGDAGSALLSLRRKGLVVVERRTVLRDPMAGREVTTTAAPQLTAEQEAAWTTLEQGIRMAFAKQGTQKTYLLHGVTGSGKTELYLRSLALAAKLGKRAIVLVPEIALTPQTIERFASRFPGEVAVLHSRLSLGEQFDEWQRIRDGAFKVVIGSRGAIFAPQPDLGLIVLDEEHEPTYKQDQSPRYHAREVALKLGQLCGAVVILGSATPEVESYYRSERGQFVRLELPSRVGAGGGGERGLPRVDVVDMRQELRAGSRGPFSRALTAALTQVLEQGEQAILFLNRRGSASFVQCRQCGHVLACRRCSLALTYHSAGEALVCHQCGYRIRAPETCPQCFGPRIRYVGMGTEKVEDEAQQAFPQARFLRWDREATRGKGSHERILSQFLSRQADVLIGTQMVAKGLHLPEVTLVGVINSDIALHLPHFRSEERTFQLLTQVAGRAGRGPAGGRVIIQTFTPENPAIIAAAQQDYSLFYEQEIEQRRRMGYPPFRRVVRLLYTDVNPRRCETEAGRLAQRLREERDVRGLSQPEVLGPTPAYLARVRGRYRWQVILLGPEPHALLEGQPLPRGWSVDVDPVDLL